MRVRKLETNRRVQTFENDLTSLSPFQAHGVKQRNAFKTYLSSVYPAAMVSFTCRNPYSDDR